MSSVAHGHGATVALVRGSGFPFSSCGATFFSLATRSFQNWLSCVLAIGPQYIGALYRRHAARSSAWVVAEHGLAGPAKHGKHVSSVRSVGSSTHSRHRRHRTPRSLVVVYARCSEVNSMSIKLSFEEVQPTRAQAPWQSQATPNASQRLSVQCRARGCRWKQSVRACISPSVAAHHQARTPCSARAAGRGDAGRVSTTGSATQPAWAWCTLDVQHCASEEASSVAPGDREIRRAVH